MTTEDKLREGWRKWAEEKHLDKDCAAMAEEYWLTTIHKVLGEESAKTPDMPPSTKQIDAKTIEEMKVLVRRNKEIDAKVEAMRIAKMDERVCRQYKEAEEDKRAIEKGAELYRKQNPAGTSD